MQTQTERGSAPSLLAVAQWNESASVRAKRKGDMVAAERLREQAKRLRQEAKEMLT